MKEKAFTLAEVLITLTIIGVIAALTIPTLMKKWQDHHTVVAVKEVYTILDNAIKTMYANEGNPEDWSDWEGNSGNLFRTNAGKVFLSKLAPYLKFQKICYDKKGCAPVRPPENDSNYNTYTSLGGKYPNACGSDCYFDNNINSKALLANGMMIAIYVLYPMGYDTYYSPSGYAAAAAKWMGYIRVDINGNKGPNRFGYDTFFFGLTKTGLSLKRNAIQQTESRSCNASTDTNYGMSCSYWVLTKGNLDYQKRDVSAEW